MSRPWAVRVPLSRVSAAAALRLIPGITACAVGDDLWLRGDDDSNQSLERALARLAPSARFAVLPDGALVPHAHSLPNGFLPRGVIWAAIADLLGPQLQSGALPADLPPPLSLTLHRSVRERPATVLVTTMSSLADYGEGAPAVRLERLLFATDGTRAIIWGDPLPPLSGDRYVERSGIAALCGFEWRPAIDPPSLRRLLALKDGDLALLLPDGGWQHLRAASFVRARRSAIRFTARRVQETNP